MNIEINLFASLMKYKPDNKNINSWIMNCGDETTIKGLLNMLKIPNEKVKLIFINGIHAGLETEVKDGDRVGIFPLVAGG